MEEHTAIKSMIEKLQTATALSKCRQCGCMKKTLATLKRELSNNQSNSTLRLLKEVENSIKKMEPSNYT